MFLFKAKSAPPIQIILPPVAVGYALDALAAAGLVQSAAPPWRVAPARPISACNPSHSIAFASSLPRRRRQLRE